MYYHDLTDLLNHDSAAYAYYYALSPKTQELLRCRSVTSLDQLRRSVEDIRLQNRPEAF